MTTYQIYVRGEVVTSINALSPRGAAGEYLLANENCFLVGVGQKGSGQQFVFSRQMLRGTEAKRAGAQ